MSEVPMDDMLPDASSRGYAQGPGPQLATQREKRGWTIEQVARQLNLAPRQIQALEDDNHAALPGPASVRGFIRSYAKLLRIDPEPLLSMMPASVASINEPIPVRRALSKPFSGDRLPAIGERGAPWKTLLLFGFAVALLAGAFIVEREGWLLPAMKFGGTPHEVKMTSPVVKPAPREDAAPPLQKAGEAPHEAEPRAPVPQAESVSDKNEPPPHNSAAPAKSGDLVLNFREESWLEAYRLDGDGKGDGTRLEARLMPAGSTEAFDMSGPVSLVIGNAAGVDVTLRGKPVVLKPIGKTNVARPTLK